MDLDSTVCQVCGKAKHGAAYGHTGVLGYHQGRGQPLCQQPGESALTHLAGTLEHNGAERRMRVHGGLKTASRDQLVVIDAWSQLLTSNLSMFYPTNCRRPNQHFITSG